MKHEKLTHTIIGCAMKVHSTLGNGFQEVIYQRALAIEMQKQGLEFQREMEMTIYYEGFDIGTRRVDFFVEENIMLELKALSKLEEVHLAQAMNYCQAYNLPIGLLINFGAKSLEFKGVYNVNHTENKAFKKSSELGLKRLKDEMINPTSTNPILKSSNPTENKAFKKSSELGLKRLKDDMINPASTNPILKSSNPKNPNSDK